MRLPNAVHDRAVAEGARRAFAGRAAALRREAETLTARINDQWGREVSIVSPEAVVKIRTAALLEECAADMAGVMRP